MKNPLSLKQIWYVILFVTPAKMTFDSWQQYKDAWTGLWTGTVIALFLYGVGEGIFFLVRKLRKAKAN